MIPGIAPRYGGPSTNLWPLVQATNARTGIVAEVATTDADGPGGKVDTSVVPKGIVCHLFPRVGGEALKRSPELSRWLFDNVKNYSVVHIHSLWNEPTNRAAAAARANRVPYVVRPAGMLSAYTWQRGWLKKRAFWWLGVRSTVCKAAAIHVTSPEEAAEAKASAPKVPTVELPNGLENAAFDGEIRPQWLREQCGPNVGDRPIVLFLSRLHPKKGVADFLIPAFAALGDSAFLAIAGGVDDSTPDYGREIEQAIDRYGVRSRVAMLGLVSSANRWAAFDGAAVFCLPSENENFGSVVPEAMARGCPIVATEGVAAVRYAVKAEAGISVARRVEAITAGLRSVLSDASPRNVRGNRGREFVQRTLSWDRISERLHGVYEDVLKTNVRSTSDEA